MERASPVGRDEGFTRDPGVNRSCNAWYTFSYMASGRARLAEIPSVFRLLPSCCLPGKPFHFILNSLYKVAPSM